MCLGHDSSVHVSAGGTVIESDKRVLSLAGGHFLPHRVTLTLLSTIQKLSEENRERVVDMLATFTTREVHRWVCSHLDIQCLV